MGLAGCAPTDDYWANLRPLVSALVNRFGCRRVTITGSLLASFSIFVSTFSPNIYIMIVTLGFLTGLGIGMMYIPAIIIIGFYFERRRALANGLGMCGSGIGFFAYAPLTKYLFEIFYWKGGLIIIAGITLHGVISGAVYRTIEEDDEEDESDLTTKPRQQGKNGTL
ncbi:monocarboxylate transporter 2-like [Lingula anatina]|uniref:Monocarboxylate transporter 2-like n=1 Tax=Lingula anatina TaxID=7574 RepID=A0A1S3KE88_LINAN|nr:monocarboxylate transporter 2-like [Lingula anatina]|eukprot:XP_013420945.1 monocarboxylate transporter 2-like [Lingula anatina]